VADINIGYEELVNTQVIIDGPNEDFASFKLHSFIFVELKLSVYQSCISQDFFSIFLLHRLNLAPRFRFLYALQSNSNFTLDLIVTSL
jgi:hypothetical protein